MARGCPLQTMAQHSGSCDICLQGGPLGPCALLKTQQETDGLKQSLQRIEQQLQALQRDVSRLK